MAPREVELHEALVREWDQQSLEVELLVSKGYYVRSFARDLGDALGVPAHLAELRRTASGPFTESEAHPFPLAEGAEPQSLFDVVRRALPTRTLTAEGLERAQDGKSLRPEDFEGEPGGQDGRSEGTPQTPSVSHQDEAATPVESAADANDAGSQAVDVPSELDVSEDGEDLDGTLVACLHGQCLVALATVQSTGILKVVRGIHDPGLVTPTGDP
jgi:hypothetical protein